MNRRETITAVSSASIQLEQIADALYRMGATFSMVERVRAIASKLDDLRVDIQQADLLNEGN
jgi:hypothetical protein